MCEHAADHAHSQTAVQACNARQERLGVVFVCSTDETEELGQRRARWEAGEGTLLRLGLDCLGKRVSLALTTDQLTSTG